MNDLKEIVVDYQYTLFETDVIAMPVQVCGTLVDPQTRKREIAALVEATYEINTNTGFIVIRNEEDIIQIKASPIRIISAWKFLIGLKETG